MATTTTVAAYRAAIVAAAAADADISGARVQVEYWEPGDDRREEVIWLGNVTESGDSEDVYLKSGRRRRHETYELTLHIQVASRQTPQVNEARAAEIVGWLEDILALDTTLSVSGVLWAIPTGFEWNTDMSGAGGTPRTTVEMTVQVKGDLQ